MRRQVFDVVHEGDHWTIRSHGEALMVTRTKKTAQRIAREARESLDDHAPARVSPEPRSFRDD